MEMAISVGSFIIVMYYQRTHAYTHIVHTHHAHIHGTYMTNTHTHTYIYIYTVFY